MEACQGEPLKDAFRQLGDQPTSTEVGCIPAASAQIHAKATREEISIELTRKSIHLLIAFVPLLNWISRTLAVSLLTAGIISYTIFEFLRMRGIKVPLVSELTLRAARLRDSGRFVVGPITLGLGALISVLVFSPPVSAIAVYVLAFGDGLSSLVGKVFGRVRLPFSRGKSLEGSIVCFLSSFIATLAITGSILNSLLIALTATFVEALPTQDWDNIILPVVTGILASLLIG